MRLDKFVANNTSFSRSEVKALLKQGRLTVNDTQARSASQALQSTDIVALDGRLIEQASDIYVMLHKPPGYVCANHDAEHPTVLDLLANQTHLNPCQKPLQIAGRLDKDTTGLLLLTSNGQWNHRITAPNHECGKSYRVECAEPITQECITAIESGLILRNETRATRPAQITLLSETRAELSIYEGMYHQVKRMFAACGNRVVTLHRFAIGPVTLDESLAQGQARALNLNEIHAF